MVFLDEANWSSFLRCVADLIGSAQVLSMRDIPHHPGCNCYEHSVFVAYVAFRLARRWGLDYRTAARCGLLHDLYLYNAREPGTHPGNQCFDHPVAAVRNARALCGTLSSKEENIIISHMWPLAKRRPRSKEAAVVNLADKFCATAEVTQIWRAMRMRQLVSA
ncbi:HD domain-containing protein [Pseudoflavonifractor sp. 524-17]|uniref:HD domain-containing protein n=1 Tax=Pseudoflavonifractor sp. 524-17 TaxID=2304577 RepID=UPI001379FCA7|nr:HD domain-containing protein [Pseudoflavonifractor sp. 524-17]NCE63801.1 HD domain-containing protein [Pseudoflavonifractor sp. 524-17]